jgi:hypothetical protein
MTRPEASVHVQLVTSAEVGQAQRSSWQRLWALLLEDTQRQQGSNPAGNAPTGDAA